MQGQIGGLFKAAFVINQFWSLLIERILPVTDAITKEVQNPLAEQMISPNTARWNQWVYTIKKKFVPWDMNLKEKNPSAITRHS